jgi:hypothetical protein
MDLEPLIMGPGADQSLFVTVGSVNPTLTGLVLTRKVAQAAVALATGAAPPP